MRKTGKTLLSSNEQINSAGDQYVIARQKDMGVGYEVEAHSHTWYQLMYASSGLLNVAFADQLMVVPPQKAIWLPPNCLHSTLAPAGAQFRSLYFRPDKVVGLGDKSKVLNVSPLTRELILSVVERCDMDLGWQEKDDRLLAVLLDLLTDQPENNLGILVPKNPRLERLVVALQSDPSNPMTSTQWAQALGMSSRTLSRLFLAETGFGFKEWRQRIRLLHSLSLLEQGMSVTQVALEVGYQSTSAFGYAFQQCFSMTPKQYFV